MVEPVTLIEFDEFLDDMLPEHRFDHGLDGRALTGLEE
jgi:hypothetical protein